MIFQISTPRPNECRDSSSHPRNSTEWLQWKVLLDFLLMIFYFIHWNNNELIINSVNDDFSSLNSNSYGSCNFFPTSMHHDRVIRMKSFFGLTCGYFSYYDRNFLEIMTRSVSNEFFALNSDSKLRCIFFIIS